MAQALLVTPNKEFALRGTRDEQTLPTLFDGLIRRGSHWAADLSLIHPVRRVMHVHFVCFDFRGLVASTLPFAYEPRTHLGVRRAKQIVTSIIQFRCMTARDLFIPQSTNNEQTPLAIEEYKGAHGGRAEHDWRCAIK